MDVATAATRCIALNRWDPEVSGGGYDTAGGSWEMKFGELSIQTPVDGLRTAAPASLSSVILFLNKRQTNGRPTSNWRRFLGELWHRLAERVKKLISKIKNIYI